jgi:hypothetical protein
MNRYDKRAMSRHDPDGSFRHRRVGIILIGIGFGLIMLIAVSGDSLREGLGVGGFFVALGLAFLVNAVFEPFSASAAATPPVPPSQPPGSDPRQESRPSQ